MTEGLKPFLESVQSADANYEAISTGSPAPVLLRGEGLKVAFGGQVVLDGVDLDLRRAEVVLLRGENGSGKTTLLNILTGHLEPDAGVIHYQADHTARTYQFPRLWWQELNPFDHFTPEFIAREGIGRTWQDVRLFGSQSLRDNIAVAKPGHPGENPILALFAPGRSARREEEINLEAESILSRLGLSDRKTSSADKISLGQSKRVAIARAIAAGALILFLDEPLAGLDHQGISDVLTLLESLVREHELTLVIVEHIFNQAHLSKLVTTDWLLENGKLHRNGAASWATDNCHRTAYAGRQRPAWFSLLADHETETLDEALPRGASLTRVRRRRNLANTLKPILEIRNLVVNRGPRTVIGLDDHGSPAGFNLTLYEGEIAILQAPNGWGKSTLFAAIMGLTPIDRGEIFLEDHNLAELSTWNRVRLGLRALPSGDHTFHSLRAKEALQLAGSSKGSEEIRAIADVACSSLSGGEKQRVALSCVFGGSVTIYDEPFAALDGPTQATVAKKVGVPPALVLVPSASICEPNN